MKDELATLPKIAVSWNAERQGVALEFDANEFKTPDMIIAVLEMAISEMKFRQSIMRAQHMQAQQAQAMQAAHIRNQLKI